VPGVLRLATNEATIAVVGGTSTGVRQKRPASARPQTAIIATENNGDAIFKFGDAFFVKVNRLMEGKDLGGGNRGVIVFRDSITPMHSCSLMHFELSAASSSPMEVQAGIVEIKPGIDVLPQPRLRLGAGCFRVGRVTKVRRSYGFRLVDQH
jgi:hypothetical protein